MEPWGGGGIVEVQWTRQAGEARCLVGATPGDSAAERDLFPELEKKRRTELKVLPSATIHH